MEEKINVRYLDHEKPIHDWFWRCLDVLGAWVAILLSLPILLFVACCIKMEDRKGPILFKQKRVGKDGRLFCMYKFRSMLVDAESQLDKLKEQNEVEGLMFKMKDDPRITKVGKWIRRTSIDEFPQFINILRGEMSFVGPRPPLVSEYNEYNHYEKQRLLVKPGCTGLWQISGRNMLSFEQMVQLDLEYIHKRSIIFNLKILLFTFKELTTRGNGM